MKKILILAFAIPILFSCGKEEKSNENTDIIEYNESSPNSTTTTTQASQTTNHIVIKANEDMTFDQTKFNVKVGEEITLLLMNNGTSSKEVMGHNAVVLQQGVDLNGFAFAASSEKENDYIPKDKISDIIIHTKLLGPKENDQVKFKLENAGTYDFLCTFPGHAATMRGQITAVN
ncbi:MAG: Azurin [Flavobacteriaceae bacterium]|nr:Azurin [Candidatus Onthonaster equi]